MAKLGWAALKAVVDVGIAWCTAKAYGKEDEFTWDEKKQTFVNSFVGNFVGSYGIGLTAICAGITGYVTFMNNLNDGESLRTALLVSGITAIGFFCTMNNMLEIAGYKLQKIPELVTTASFGTGNNLVVEASKNSILNPNVKNTDVLKGYWSSIGYETRDYTIVRNGKLMK